MADTNRNQWEERSRKGWQQDSRNQDDRSRDDYSSNYGNNAGESKYGGTGFRSDYEGNTPYGNNYSGNNYSDSNSYMSRDNERRDDYSNLDRNRQRSSNMGSGYDPYNSGQTRSSYNQGKDGSYHADNDHHKRGYAPSYDRMFDNDSGYDSDYNRSYGRRDANGSGSYYGNSQNERARGEWNDRTGNRNRNTDTRQGNRDWWDRATDEVASWFGDDDAERRRDVDRRMGPHRGKGPKGYQRSDERIKDDLNDRLSDDSFVDASEVDVTVEGCEVVLTGTVDSKEEKRRAEDIAERVSGVKNVENRLKVRKRENTGATIYRDRD